MAGWVNLDPISRASTGGIAPASWGDQVNDNFTAQANGHCSVFLFAAGVSVATGADTLVPLDRVIHDPLNMFSPATHLITVPQTGTYRVSWQVAWTAVVPGAAMLYVNATSGAPQFGGASGSASRHPGEVVGQWAAGSTFGLDAFQSSGAAATLDTLFYATRLSVQLIGL